MGYRVLLCYGERRVLFNLHCRKRVLWNVIIMLSIAISMMLILDPKVNFVKLSSKKLKLNIFHSQALFYLYEQTFC
jgi:hypothetical protein